MFRKLNEPVGYTLTVFIDGEPVEAESGETVAAVLLRQPIVRSRTTPVNESPRAPFCMMGVCFDCLVVVDGVASVQSCLVSVQQGMRIERQFGRRRLVS
ncbi:(2Fe-2S)-binding protein [Caballeronia sp. GACF5]|uniref:(2Fe-2S)-binding protein n=1 Tax=Caballeronia sp. GACF5 TaxID=2921746 RepID=UPI002029930B|nr:(2Fe-2S)-binding protein [Caballeronia sp. GACF5]